MGGIWMPGAQIRGVVSELVGHKSGFALTLEEILDHAPNEYHDYLQSPDEEVCRIRSESFEDLVCGILYELGTVSTRHMVSPVISACAKVRDDPEERERVLRVFETITELHREALETAVSSGSKVIDPVPIVEACVERHGRRGREIAIQYLVDVQTMMIQSPFSSPKLVRYEDKIALKQLFESESLDTLYGEFIDQRFVDYLDANHEQLFKMNWRKFEGLAGE